MRYLTREELLKYYEGYKKMKKNNDRLLAELQEKEKLIIDITKAYASKEIEYISQIYLLKEQKETKSNKMIIKDIEWHILKMLKL